MYRIANFNFKFKTYALCFLLSIAGKTLNDLESFGTEPTLFAVYGFKVQNNLYETH